MSYKALLFCPDERTARVVTQVLSELEFQVDACNEPFAAVKKLMAGHFDAVVVDCDSEQNATLLFKSARNSEFNQASLSVAVVEGQSGVAKAFRIGANLVLTKPINVEQSKGTLRVARGLLRKNETAKTSGTASAPATRTSIAPPQPAHVSRVTVPKPAFLSQATPPLVPAAMASSTSAFELEKDPTPEPEPSEAALLESMPDPANKIHTAGTTPAPKQYPWQTNGRPTTDAVVAGSTMAGSMTTALKHAAEATGRPDTGISVGHGTAVAPAKSPLEDDDIPELEEDSLAPSANRTAPAPKPHSAGAEVNWGRIAAIIVVAAAGFALYHAGNVMRWRMPDLAHWLQRSAVSANPRPAKSTTSPATAAAASTTVQPNSILVTTTAAASQKPSPAGVETIVLPSVPKKSAVPSTSFDPPTPQSVVKTIGEGTVFVNTQTPRPAVPKPAAADNVEPAAPDAVTSDSNSSDDNAISGLVSMPSTVPQPGPQTLKISQGVSQGLLIKKVAPVYPARALRTHVQGSVQLLATISKDGEITKVTVLSGDNGLARAAMEAVKQWKYRPYLLDSQPMEIQTQITVNFKLP